MKESPACAQIVKQRVYVFHHGQTQGKPLPAIVYDAIIPTPATLFVRNMPRASAALRDFQESGPSSQRER